jgi:hypothetical protein
VLQKKNYAKEKKMSCFHAYGQISKKNHIIFSYNNENFKKYVLACILTLITSLLKSWELGQYFKKNQFCFLLILRITLLYVKHIPDIKNVVLLCIDFRAVKFYLVR